MRTELTAGTRRSALALWQTRWFCDMLRQAQPGLQITERQIVTRGDRILDKPLSKIGEKGLFTAELEEALLEGEIDFAVNSLKDLPTTLPEGLALGGLPIRVSPFDLLVHPEGLGLQQLPPGSRVGTGSLRRRALIAARRPDLQILEIRGNVDTRLRKLAEGEYDAILLAEAGFTRLSRTERATVLDGDWYYAPGQGALGVEVRADDLELQALLQSLEPAGLRERVVAERSFLGALEGGCQIPLGVRTRLYGNELELAGMVAAIDGSRVVEGQRSVHLPLGEGRLAVAAGVGEALAVDLLERGAGEILAEIRRAQ